MNEQTCAKWTSNNDQYYRVICVGHYCSRMCYRKYEKQSLGGRTMFERVDLVALMLSGNLDEYVRAICNVGEQLLNH